MRTKTSQFLLDLSASIIFIFVFVNPYVENLMYYDPLLYMLSHYSIFAAGIILGYKFLRANQFYFYLGILPAAFWHLPYPFLLGASFLNFRILSEITLFLGGISVGSSLKAVTFRIKIAFLTLWMFADTYLSVIFILGNDDYTSLAYSFSKYLPEQLPIVGIAMLILMNVIIAYVIYIYIRGYLKRVPQNI